MNSAKDSIADRLFEWSQKQITFEASSVFNRLSLLPSNEAHAFVALYRQWAAETRPELCSA